MLTVCLLPDWQMRILLFCFLLVAFSHAANRLRVSGSQLFDPLTNKPVRLTGFNMGGTFHGNDTAFMREILPGANVVRLVGLLWDNAEV